MPPDTTGPGTQPEVVEPDSKLESMAAVLDPVPGTQLEPAQGSTLEEQSAPEPVQANPSESAEQAPNGSTEPAPVAAAKLMQEAQLEPGIQPGAPAESGSQSMETPPITCIASSGTKPKSTTQRGTNVSSIKGAVPGRAGSG